MADAIMKRTMSERVAGNIGEIVSGRRKGGMRTVLLFAGPAVIASIAYMDPGNFATNIQAGSKYGYALLWVVLLANMIAMLFQALSAKLGIVTGHNLAELCREALPAGRRRDHVGRQRDCGHGNGPRGISRRGDRSRASLQTAS